MTIRVSIHTNREMPHQVEYAAYLQAGFKRLGMAPTVTTARTDDADLHVVQGPHYALNENKGKNTIFLDRAYWNHPREYVSLAWIDKDGAKVWAKNAPGDRQKPKLRPWGTVSERALVLNDFDRQVPLPGVKMFFKAIEVRDHPARSKPTDRLTDALERNDVAIGYTSTALVSAVIRGLAVICFDEHSPVYPVASHGLGSIVRPDRAQWLNNLSYMNWHHKEIESGEALEHLLCQRP